MSRYTAAPGFWPAVPGMICPSPTRPLLQGVWRRGVFAVCATTIRRSTLPAAPCPITSATCSPEIHDPAARPVPPPLPRPPSPKTALLTPSPQPPASLPTWWPGETSPKPWPPCGAPGRRHLPASVAPSSISPMAPCATTAGRISSSPSCSRSPCPSRFSPCCGWPCTASTAAPTPPIRSSIRPSLPRNAAWGKFKGVVNGVLRNALRQSAELKRRPTPTWWRSFAIRPGGSAACATSTRTPGAPSWPPATPIRRWPCASIAGGPRCVRCCRPSPPPICPCASSSNGALLLDRPVPVARVPGFAEGLVSVQDAGAQYAAGYLDLADGQRVLDACAAPGGKTSHILERADVDLTALDADACSRPSGQ
jgi:hypothetical protein